MHAVIMTKITKISRRNRQGCEHMEVKTERTSSEVGKEITPGLQSIPACKCGHTQCTIDTMPVGYAFD